MSDSAIDNGPSRQSTNKPELRVSIPSLTSPTEFTASSQFLTPQQTPITPSGTSTSSMSSLSASVKKKHRRSSVFKQLMQGGRLGDEDTASRRLSMHQSKPLYYQRVFPSHNTGNATPSSVAVSTPQGSGPSRPMTPNTVGADGSTHGRTVIHRLSRRLSKLVPSRHNSTEVCEQPQPRNDLWFDAPLIARESSPATPLEASGDFRLRTSSRGSNASASSKYRRGYSTTVLPFDTELPEEEEDTRAQWRIKLEQAMESRGVTVAVLLLILVDLITLAMDSPNHREDDPKASDVLGAIHLGVTILFTAEVILRCTAVGPRPYITRGWNQFDALLVLVSWVDFITSVTADHKGFNFSSFRAWRATRGLRSFQHMEAMKGSRIARVLHLPEIAASVSTIFLSLTIGAEYFLAAFVLFFLFLTFFAVLALNSYTNDLVDIRVDGSFFPGFTHFGGSILTMLKDVSLDRWTIDMMELRSQGPEKAAPLFYVILIVVVSYFCSAIFIAVMSSVFGRVRKEEQRAIFTYQNIRFQQKRREVDLANMRYRRLNRNLKNSSNVVHRLSCKFRLLCYRIVKDNPWFHGGIVAAILLNAIVMSLTYHGMPDSYANALDITESVFTVLFFLEMVIKMGGYGAKTYFNETSNRVDCFIVFTTMAGLILQIANLGGQLKSVSSVRLIRLVRLTRAFRISRLLNSVASVRKLLAAAFQSVLSVINVCVVIFFVLVIVSISAVHLFGSYLDEASTFEYLQNSVNLHFEDNETTEFMRSYCMYSFRPNFTSFADALLSLLQVVTSSNWTLLMDRLIVDGAEWESPVFLSLFFIASYYVLMNLFLAVVLENFELAETEKAARLHRYEKKMTREYDFLFDAAGNQRESTVDSARSSKGMFQRIAVAGAAKTKWLADTRAARWFCERSTKIVNHPWFDRVVLLAIFFSCVLLTLDRPGDDSDVLPDEIMTVLDAIFLLFFIFEFALKVGCYGFMLPSNAYLRDGWNRLDFLVLVITTLSTSSSVRGLRSFRAGRALRALRGVRSLRFLSHSASSKVMLTALFRSLPAILNVVLLVMFFTFICAVLGLHTFGGMLWACSDPLVSEKEYCVGEYVHPIDGTNVTREWQNAVRNFDNIGNSLLTLTEVALLQDWHEVMYQCMDIRGVDEAPEKNSMPAAAIFFVFFILIMPFFLLKLMIGVIIYKFNKTSGSSVLTEEQLRWRDMQQISLNMLEEAVKPPRGSFGRFCYWLTYKNTKFDIFIASVIVINVAFLASVTADGTSGWNSAIDVVNLVCYIIYVLEMIAKLVGLRREYWRDKWNILDAAIVLASTVSYILVPIGAVVQVARGLRVFLILRLMSGASTLRSLLNTLYLSLPAIWNVSLILVLWYFVNATIFMEAFYDVDRLNATEFNFRDWPATLVTLMKITTGDRWYQQMHICMDSSPGLAPILFILFFFISNTIVMSLFIAVIMDNFAICFVKEESIVTDHHLRQFKEVWASHVKPRGSRFLPLYQLRPFLEELGEPLGAKPMHRLAYLAVRIEAQMHTRNVDQGIPFRNLLVILSLNALKSRNLTENQRRKRREFEKRLEQRVAAAIIAAYFRGYVVRVAKAKKRLDEYRQRRFRDDVRLLQQQSYIDLHRSLNRMPRRRSSSQLEIDLAPDLDILDEYESRVNLTLDFDSSDREESIDAEGTAEKSPGTTGTSLFSVRSARTPKPGGGYSSSFLSPRTPFTRFEPVTPLLSPDVRSFREHPEVLDALSLTELSLSAPDAAAITGPEYVGKSWVSDRTRAMLASFAPTDPDSLLPAMSSQLHPGLPTTPTRVAAHGDGRHPGLPPKMAASSNCSNRGGGSVGSAVCGDGDGGSHVGRSLLRPIARADNKRPKRPRSLRGLNQPTVMPPRQESVVKKSSQEEVSPPRSQRPERPFAMHMGFIDDLGIDRTLAAGPKIPAFTARSLGEESGDRSGRGLSERDYESPRGRWFFADGLSELVTESDMSSRRYTPSEPRSPASSRPRSPSTHPAPAFDTMIPRSPEAGSAPSRDEPQTGDKAFAAIPQPNGRATDEDTPELGINLDVPKDNDGSSTFSTPPESLSHTPSPGETPARTGFRGVYELDAEGAFQTDSSKKLVPPSPQRRGHVRRQGETRVFENRTSHSDSSSTLSDMEAPPVRPVHGVVCLAPPKPYTRTASSASEVHTDDVTDLSESDAESRISQALSLGMETKENPLQVLRKSTDGNHSGERLPDVPCSHSRIPSVQVSSPPPGSSPCSPGSTPDIGLDRDSILGSPDPIPQSVPEGSPLTRTSSEPKPPPEDTCLKAEGSLVSAASVRKSPFEGTEVSARARSKNDPPLASTVLTPSVNNPSEGSSATSANSSPTSTPLHAPRSPSSKQETSGAVVSKPPAKHPGSRSRFSRSSPTLNGVHRPGKVIPRSPIASPSISSVADLEPIPILELSARTRSSSKDSAASEADTGAPSRARKGMFLRSGRRSSVTTTNAPSGVSQRGAYLAATRRPRNSGSSRF
eukprot:Rmarinus@m.3152